MQAPLPPWLIVPRHRFARLRRAVADRITASLGGTEPPRVARVARPDERTFLPRDSPAQLLHTDPASSIGGIASLLFQTLHPLAAAAVAQHSGFRQDPWGRLERTGSFFRAVAFARESDVVELCARIRTIHDHVAGTTGDGEPYRASDPELLRWVHVTQLYTFVTCNQRYSRWPLGPEDIDRYVRDMVFVADQLGVPDPPTRFSAVVAQLTPFVDRARISAEAEEIIGFIRRPPITGVSRFGYRMWCSAALGLIHPDFTSHFGRRRLAVSRLAGVVSKPQVQVVRWAYGPDWNGTQLHAGDFTLTKGG